MNDVNFTNNPVTVFQKKHANFRFENINPSNMIFTYLNLTPDARIDTNTPADAAEVKSITGFNTAATKLNPNHTPEHTNKKLTSANYDEMSLLDIFGALNY